MARTLEKWTRVYIDGFDVSGFGRTIGPLEVTYDEADLTATMSDAVRGYLRNRAKVNLGIFNAVFDNTTTTGIHAVLQSAGDARTVLVAKGVQAAPAIGDKGFGGVFEQGAYQVEEDGGAVTVSVPWVGWAADAASLLFANPWGVLIHNNTAETGANSGNNGVDNPEEGATALGGIFIYQVLAGSGGSGLATLSIDDSPDNSSDWQALSGATSGEIDCRDRQAAIVALGTAATVRRYTRWQLALSGGGATSVTFVAALLRAF